MKNYLAIVGLTVAAVSVSTAWGGVVTGTAAKVPAKEVNVAAKDLGRAGGTAMGPLAPSLQGKPVVVRIHADWCTACKATHATLSDLKRAYAGKIHFVEFNVTNGTTAAAAHAQATKLGLAKFYDVTKADTSTVAVIDPKTGKVYGTFYNDGNLKDYETAVNDVMTAEKTH